MSSPFKTLTVALLIFVSPAGAHAQVEHRVRSGQSLARIAQRYEVTVANLAAANQLRRTSQLHAGQVLRIPERGVVYVAQGDTLASIARDNGCSVGELRSANRLNDDAALRIGQRLQLPGFDAIRERETAQRRWGAPRSAGVAELYRRSLDRRLRVRLVDSRGRARRTARRRVQELMRTLRGTRPLGPSPPPRLIEILARVSDHFGGRLITIVSGYRSAGGDTRTTSRHTAGNALDIRITGVPNNELRDYVRETFNNVGVGFYPRSHFVHVDVRDRDSYWVDWSGPGESPEYQRHGEDPEENDPEASTDAAPTTSDQAEAE